MKFYIATSLERAEIHNKVRDVLVERGDVITYDWTKHGSVQHEGHNRLAEVAHAEMIGVQEADVVIVLLPGGRGTHAELGMGIAYHRHVLVVAAAAEGFFGNDARTCAFYHAPKVTRLTLADWDDPCEIAAIADVAEDIFLGR